MTADRVTVRLAVSPRRSPKQFDVDKDTWRHLVALYRFRRRHREALDPCDLRGLIWFAVKAGQR